MRAPADGLPHDGLPRDGLSRDGGRANGPGGAGAGEAGMPGASREPPAALQLHASAVAVEGRGCLITGRAGAGKSTLAIEMLALGAELVADDRVDIRRAGDALILSAPAPISGLVEARGAGILRLPARADTPLALVIDLDEAERERLPDARRRVLLGVPCPLLLGRGRAGLAALATVLLRAGGACDAAELGPG
jgi:HPr kinase/phosphorylase